MPKVTEKSHKTTYPPGCKELHEGLSTDELLKRLKLLARAFQEMGQDENSQYTQLTLHIASEFFLDHNSKDVRLLIACCIADIFRIFAPDAPYKDGRQLKEIFKFLTEQLAGLREPEAPSFKRYFYLLENLAYVKSFNICLEVESNQEIFCKLFKLLLGTINEKHTAKVSSFMLDIMCPLITEADAVSQEMLDVILTSVIEPHKSQNKWRYNLAKDLIVKTADMLEPYAQTFFNSALMLGKVKGSQLSEKLYELIFELNQIAPSILLAVMPQLEFKLKSSTEADRMTVTRLLSRMFSAPNSNLATQNKALWSCYLGRFNDIDVAVRKICVESAQQFLVNQPDLIPEVTEHLCQRQHDPDEGVRIDVVQSIVGALKKDFSAVSDDLLGCIKERTLDKKFKIRKEALLGLGQIYKLCLQVETPCTSEVERIAWIRDKILHAYYQNSLDDKILVERILNTVLVPYSLEPAERMKRLYTLYACVDDHSVKALQEVFRAQMGLCKIARSLVELIEKYGDSDEFTSQITSKVIQLSRNLPDATKTQDHMKRFSKIVQEDRRVHTQLVKLLGPDCTCKRAEECVKEIMKKLGNPTPQNYVYSTVKVLLERIAPVMIDSVAIQELVSFVSDAVKGTGAICDEIPNATENGMKLLLLLSWVYPSCFHKEDILRNISVFVKDEDDVVSDYALQIFHNIGQYLKKNFPAIHTSLLPVLQKLVKLGTPKQAKHAIRCIHALYDNGDAIYQQIFEHLQANLDLESPYFLTTLVAIGHIAQLCPGKFAMPVRGIVSKFIVKELLMQDRIVCRRSTESWCADHLVSEETQAKLQGLKMMVRWLLGLKSNSGNSGTSTLRLLTTLILHDGDLMERGAVNKAEMARLRLQATCCILKLAQEPCYSDLITLDQFQTFALLLNDPCYQVRVRFAQKLNKGLLAFRLPLQYLSIFCLVANDPLKERRVQVKQFLLANISRRREYLRQHSAANARMFALLPDYAVPYAIHLLAHDPDLRSHEDVDTLKNIKECLWFLLEPLMKIESYSYSFYRKLVENIKQTKDVQCLDNPDANKKMYAVCDLVLGIILMKTTNFILKDFPAEPVLPSKLFTQPDQSYSNTTCYLPRELMVQVTNIKKMGPSAVGAAPSSAAARKDSPEPPSPPPAPSPSERRGKAPGGITRTRGYTASPSPPSSDGSLSPERPTGRGARKVAAPVAQAAKTVSGRATRRRLSGSVSSSNSKDSSSRKASPESSAKSPRLPDTESPTSSPREPRRSGGNASKQSSGQSKITDFVKRARKTLGSPEVAASARTAASPPKQNKLKPKKLMTTAAAASKGRTTTQKNASEKSRSANGGAESEESEGSKKRGHQAAVVETHATRSGKLSKTKSVVADKGSTTKRLKVVVTTKATRRSSPEHNGDSSGTRSSPRKSGSQDSKSSTRSRGKVTSVAASKTTSKSPSKTSTVKRSNVRQATSTTNSVGGKTSSKTSLTSTTKRTRTTSDDSDVAELSVRRRNKKRR